MVARARVHVGAKWKVDRSLGAWLRPLSLSSSFRRLIWTTGLSVYRGLTTIHSSTIPNPPKQEEMKRSTTLRSSSSTLPSDQHRRYRQQHQHRSGDWEESEGLLMTSVAVRWVRRCGWSGGWMVSWLLRALIRLID